MTVNQSTPKKKEEAAVSLEGEKLLNYDGRLSQQQAQELHPRLCDQIETEVSEVSEFY